MRGGILFKGTPTIRQSYWGRILIPEEVSAHSLKTFEVSIALRGERKAKIQAPERAYCCRYYDTCLAIDSYFNRQTLPCRDCKERQDIAAYDMQDNDMLNYRLLLIAIFYPEVWQASLFYRLRNLSFCIESETNVREQREFEPE